VILPSFIFFFRLDFFFFRLGIFGTTGRGRMWGISLTPFVFLVWADYTGGQQVGLPMSWWARVISTAVRIFVPPQVFSFFSVRGWSLAVRGTRKMCCINNTYKKARHFKSAARH